MKNTHNATRLQRYHRSRAVLLSLNPKHKRIQNISECCALTSPCVVRAILGLLFVWCACTAARRRSWSIPLPARAAHATMRAAGGTCGSSAAALPVAETWRTRRQKPPPEEDALLTVCDRNIASRGSRNARPCYPKRFRVSCDLPNKVRPPNSTRVQRGWVYARAIV